MSLLEHLGFRFDRFLLWFMFFSFFFCVFLCSQLHREGTDEGGTGCLFGQSAFFFCLLVSFSCGPGPASDGYSGVPFRTQNEACPGDFRSRVSYNCGTMIRSRRTCRICSLSETSLIAEPAATAQLPNASLVVSSISGGQRHASFLRCLSVSSHELYQRPWHQPPGFVEVQFRHLDL